MSGIFGTCEETGCNREADWELNKEGLIEIMVAMCGTLLIYVRDAIKKYRVKFCMSEWELLK